jgi:pyruvate/2-oxoglutarate dehydrogenase complex dihydrolipoamide dehydrogenase (E3) component
MAKQKIIETEICVIGAGSGGLSIASGAAQLGMNVVLIEKADMGGDCLNTGCVPSKALLAAGKRAQAHRKNDISGIKAHEPEIDFSAVKDHVFDVIGTIAPHDSQERFEGLGVHVIREFGEFVDSHTIKAGDHIIKAKKFVISTGSRAFVPPIKGIDESKVLTNESIFELRDKPDHLLIIGGGPIGLEMAQAHRRLGCEVSVVDMGGISPRDDQKNVEVVRQALIKEGINLYENFSINEVKHGENNHAIVGTHEGKDVPIKGSHILVAAGRKPNSDKIGLDKANIKHDRRGITVNDKLQSSQKHIHAIGDVAGGPQFTHVAGYHAGLLIKQICFKIPVKVNYAALPWVTYTDPELAQVGLTEDIAREKYGDSIKVVEWHFNENDRAIAEKTMDGQARVITDKKGRVLGASIVGPHAGELIAVWGLAISQKMKIGAMTSTIVAYPTLGEINKRAAGSYYTPSLFSDKTRKIVRFLQKLPW